MKDLIRNSKPFNEICHNAFGREVIYTNVQTINRDNLLKELNKALYIHSQNKAEIDYLYNYYLGNQPVLYRSKTVRPEINNKVVQNTAYFIVETKTADIASEPIQYVLRGVDETKSQMIADLNAFMDAEDKSYLDACIARWRSICGTSYRFLARDNNQSLLLDETAFRISVEDPRDCFVVYYSRNKLPAFSCQIFKDAQNKTVYGVYTNSAYYEISGNKISEPRTNGFNAIPLVEYPNNENRLSDIEVTISLSDALNHLVSDQLNGVEGFVQSFIKFVNCEMDEKKFKQLRQSGAFVVKSNNGDNKADVDIMSSELNQTQTQVVVNDLFEKILVIQGIANREGNTGGDTGQAVNLRNGWFDSERRAELSEPIFKKSEKQFLRILLHAMRSKRIIDLNLSDIEIKISRSKMDNMLVKAETLKLLLDSGINSERAIKSVGYFADPEQVAIESKEQDMDILYPTTKEDVDEV